MAPEDTTGPRTYKWSLSARIYSSNCSRLMTRRSPRASVVGSGEESTILASLLAGERGSTDEATMFGIGRLEE